jgi:hypothetical protein
VTAPTLVHLLIAGDGTSHEDHHHMTKDETANDVVRSAIAWMARTHPHQLRRPVAVV